MKYEGQQLGKCISSKEMDLLLLYSKGILCTDESPLLCSLIFLKNWCEGCLGIWDLGFGRM